jgi:hypothetical protein
MSRRVISIEARAPSWVAVKIMAQTGVGCLPVTESGRVIAMIDRDRLAEAGVPLEATGALCAACGSHRHVPLRGVAALRLCVECLERASPAQLDDDASPFEIGTGD